MNVNAHSAIVKSSNHSLEFFQYMLLKMFTDSQWCSLQWRPVVSFEMALHNQYFVYNQKKH